MKKIDFRDYQQEALELIEEHFKKSDSALISIPTGGGKTVIFTNHLAQEKGLMIAHTDELVQQAKGTYEYITDKEAGLATAKVWDTSKDVSAGSIQTIHSRLESKEVEELAKKISYMVIDEAHHMGASTYKEVYQHFKEINPDLKLLGVTATPYRTDNQDMEELFGKIVFQISIKRLIQEGYLVGVHGSVINIPNFNLDDISTNGGDYSPKSLSKRLKEPETIKFIIDKFEENKKKGKSIFFTPTVEVSKMITEELSKRGVKAVHVDGDLKKEEREKIMEDYKHGKIDVLSNVDILTEGFDEPSIENVAVLRPTTSLGLYAQIIGRGLRLSPSTGKTHCNIMDFTGETEKSELANMFDLFELEVGNKEKDNLTEFTIQKVEIDGEAKLDVTYGQASHKAIAKPEYNLRDYMLHIEQNGEETSLVALRAFSSIYMKMSKDEYGLNQLQYIDINRDGDKVIDTVDGIPDAYKEDMMYKEWIKDVSSNVDKNTPISPKFKSFLKKKYSDLINNIKFFDKNGNLSTFDKEVNTKFHGMALKTHISALINEKDKDAKGYVDRHMRLDYASRCKDIPDFLDKVKKYHGDMKYVKMKPDAIIIDSVRRYYYAMTLENKSKSRGKATLKLKDRYFHLSFGKNKHSSRNMKLHINKLKDEGAMLELFKMYLKEGRIEIQNSKMNDTSLKDIFESINQMKFYKEKIEPLLPKKPLSFKKIDSISQKKAGYYKKYTKDKNNLLGKN